MILLCSCHLLPVACKFKVFVARKKQMHHAARIPLLLALTLSCAVASVRSQERRSFDVSAGPARGSLMDIKDKRRMLLMASRSYVIDSRGSARSVLNEIYKIEQSAHPPRHVAAINIIAKQLNKYIRKYHSMRSVERVVEADFIIVFKVVRDQRFFIEGEMFVIKNPTREDPHPRIVWQTKNDRASPEGAVKAFIKGLKIVRGEK